MSSRSEIPADMAAALLVLGESHAFGVVAGRCTAAQAIAMRRLREEKLYRSLAAEWREFCRTYLNMSGSNADRIIRLLDEFGPGYFEVSQLTKITAETYRAIEPSIKDGALHFQGKAIQLKPENARRVASVIATIRKKALSNNAAPKREVGFAERFDRIERRCSAMVRELETMSRQARHGENWLRFTAMLSRLRSALVRIEVETGVTEPRA